MPRREPKPQKLPGNPGNPIIQRLGKAEKRLNDHETRLTDVETELRIHNADIIVLADVLYRAKARDRMKLARRLRSARSRDAD